MALTKKNRDDPKRWRIIDRWHDAQLWGALHGVFNLAEDKKVVTAVNENDLDFIKKATEKRIAKVGKGKPKFKKVPEKKLGYEAVTVKGSRAYAGQLLNEKIFGKPKPVRKLKEKPKKKVVKKEKPPHKNPECKPNPDLPQNNAYEQAREKIKKGETLLYIFLVSFPENVYTAVYYDKKTKKKIQRKIQAVHKPWVDPDAEKRERYGDKVAMRQAINEAIKPVKAKSKKSKKF